MLDTLLTAYGLMALQWVLAVSFLYSYRLLGLFHVAHVYIIVIPSYVVLSFNQALSATLRLMAGMGLAALVAVLIDYCLYRRLSHPSRSATPGILLSLSLFYAFSSVTVLLGIPHEALSLPDSLLIGSPVAGKGRHVTVFAAAVLFCAAYLYFLYRTRTGLNVRSIMSSPLTAELHGIPVERYRAIAIVALTCIGALAVVGIAGSGSGVYPDIAFPSALLAMIAYLLSGNRYLMIGEGCLLILILVRWFAWSTWPQIATMSDDIVLIVGLALLGVLSAKRKPGELRADDHVDTSLAVERRLLPKNRE